MFSCNSLPNCTQCVFQARSICVFKWFFVFSAVIKGMFYLFPTEYAAFVDSCLLLIFWGLELSLPLVLLLLATFHRRFVSRWLQIGELETLNRTCDLSSDLFRFFHTEFDIWRTHLEELSRTSFCTLNRFIPHTVNFAVHSWDTEDS